jgi:hypothetical protein
VKKKLKKGNGKVMKNIKGKKFNMKKQIVVEFECGEYVGNGEDEY